jgi:hypothetical protein
MTGSPVICREPDSGHGQLKRALPGSSGDGGMERTARYLLERQAEIVMSAR